MKENKSLQKFLLKKDKSNYTLKMYQEYYPYAVEYILFVLEISDSDILMSTYINDEFFKRRMIEFLYSLAGVTAYDIIEHHSNDDTSKDRINKCRKFFILYRAIKSHAGLGKMLCAMDTAYSNPKHILHKLLKSRIEHKLKK